MSEAGCPSWTSSRSPKREALAVAFGHWVQRRRSRLHCRSDGAPARLALTTGIGVKKYAVGKAITYYGALVDYALSDPLTT
jgi:hypothetical protein